MIYDSHVFTSILSISNMPPPTVQPITSSHTVQSGTFYNFALCSLSCFSFVFDLPVFTFCSTEEPHNCLYQFPPELRFSTYASHCTASQLHCLYPTAHLETIPCPQIAPPQSLIGFILDLGLHRFLLCPWHISAGPRLCLWHLWWDWLCCSVV